MLTEDEQIAHADRGPPTITVAEFCRRERPDQKRLLGAMLVHRHFNTPSFMIDGMPTPPQLNNPGSLRMLDNWQAARYAERNRVVDKS